MTTFDDFKRWPNLVAMFLEKAAEGGDAPFLWTKRDGAYQPTSWQQAAETALALARALRRIGVKKGDRVLLLSESRTEWPICHFAIMAAGAMTVPAYTTNTERDHLHVIEDSGARFAIVSTPTLAKRFLKAAMDSSVCRHVITIDGLRTAQTGDIDLHDYDRLVADGRADDTDVAAWIDGVARRDTACIIYTSGTGGAPKGVMLSHGAVLANCMGAYDIIRHLGIGDDVFLSFLPLSHSYEHTGGLMFPISIGAQIYYAEAVDKLAVNLGEVRPTIMTAVPRLYEMLYQRITRVLEKKRAVSNWPCSARPWSWGAKNTKIRRWASATAWPISSVSYCCAASSANASAGG